MVAAGTNSRPQNAAETKGSAKILLGDDCPEIPSDYGLDAQNSRAVDVI
jgi:hypothetical protein